ncbi:succinyl-diaminopimelate desuccinylase [Roseospirillum parvum]|uniref:Succinyl-diaminopimelate desuccinylase n=1 Tax=Roseospirillum parvum TaxID=83401 RepID=A0A1G8B883_9PROT|nr:succinyl-diaminopimelate desuccinylase [Roseospirillum parvum]SDH29213.1 succinyl-diaminopimelate desuccinylase [Roseospirillum parvum]
MPARTFLSDPLPLARDLIRRHSVTPEDDGALEVLARALGQLGFECFPVTFEAPDTAPVNNLYARLGPAEAPNLCFAGHTDVVPAGDGWSVDPFAGRIVNGTLIGRGAADMKGAVACFVAAVARRLAGMGPPPGAISLLITGDEEGPAVNGTVRLLPWIAEKGERLSACIVGEPSNPTRMGEMIKIGRRGSVNFRLISHGRAGHAAYPHLADNPIPPLLAVLQALTAAPLDEGSDHFDPSTLALTSLDVGNRAENVIPGRAEARFNIRFNDHHHSEALISHVAETCERVAGAGRIEIVPRVSGESFLTPPGVFSTLIAEAVRAETGLEPELSTSGGTSDARFIKDYCPVAEFGLVSRTIHQADEQVPLADLETLTRVYRRLIDGFFAGSFTDSTSETGSTP